MWNEQEWEKKRRTVNERKRDRDKLPLWHYVIRTLCRLKYFMQVEISIKCCSNFLFKLMSWLNCQIIHRLHFECDLNTNQVSNLNSCVEQLNLYTVFNTQENKRSKVYGAYWDEVKFNANVYVFVFPTNPEMQRKTFNAWDKAKLRGRINHWYKEKS